MMVITEFGIPMTIKVSSMFLVLTKVIVRLLENQHLKVQRHPIAQILKK